MDIKTFENLGDTQSTYSRTYHCQIYPDGYTLPDHQDGAGHADR